MTRASTKAAEARRANASLRSSGKDCPPEMRSPSRRSPGKSSFAVERTPSSPTRLSYEPEPEPEPIDDNCVVSRRETQAF